MTGSQKTLKIVSIILIIWAVLEVLFGAFLAAGSAVPGMSAESVDVNGSTMVLSSAALAMGIGVIVGGVINLIIALLGLRGAKNPAKIGVFFVLCIIGLVLSVIGTIMSIMQGSFQWSYVVSLAIVAVCTYLASKIKKQA